MTPTYSKGAPMTPEQVRVQVMRDLVHRGMMVVSRAGSGSSFAHCSSCGYTAPVDWTDPEFGRLHGCDGSEAILAEIREPQ